MKRIIVFLVLTIDLFLLGLANNEFIVNKNNYISNNIVADATIKSSITDYKNIYYKDISFKYVQNTSLNIVNNKQEILNIVYTMINNGYDFYDFKCGSNYENCAKDLLSILNDEYSLNVINNLVSPYNSFKDISLNYLPNGMLRLNISKVYSDYEISTINSKIDYILNHIINDKMSDEEKVKQVHDYLANNIIYQDGKDSNTAYGALIKGKAICSGYADVLGLFLDKMNIANFKVVSHNHVWNVVRINNKWLHIDLTWDDPKNLKIINYDYFLIDTKKLNNNDLSEHSFDRLVYEELS